MRKLERRNRRFIAPSVAVLFLAPSLSYPAQLVLGSEIVSNTIDGSVLTDCGAQLEVEAGKPAESWIAFGKVEPSGPQRWTAAPSPTRCTSGKFEASWNRAAFGIPYLVVVNRSVPTIRPDGAAALTTSLEIRKFSSLDAKDQPVYEISNENRTLQLGPKDDSMIPLLVAGRDERDALELRELFLRMTARVLGRDAATYGSIAVTTDLPGADLHLDGGLVGRAPDDGPAVFHAVAAGKHEVRATDFSGRSASKQVVVAENQTVKADLKVINLPATATSAPLVPIGRNPQGYDESWRARDGAVVVRVPGGEFVMGSAEDKGEPTERPQRTVSVSEFLMDKTEVTWRQLRRFHDATDAELPPAPVWGARGDYPASGVLFDEAAAFCAWVGGRLPTEAEWEKAARGTDGRDYPWGNDWDPDRCNSIQGGPHRPEGVGRFPDCMSPYGLVDMAGSMWEWCDDWYTDGYPAGPAQNPHGPSESGQGRVIRGGCWIDQPPRMRAAARLNNDPDFRKINLGFRCVQPVSTQAAAGDPS